MNIIIISDVYPPEISSASSLMQELAYGLKERGHKVIVVTSQPKHYLTSEGKNKNFPTFLVENDIEVIRVKTLPLHKVNFLIRGVSQLLLPALFFRKIKKFIKKEIDVVIAYTPPLPLGLVGKKVKKHYKAKFILNVQDIFPQNAIDLGILKNKVLIKFFELIEQKVYQSADKITFHSDGGRRFLIEKKCVSQEKIVILPNWINLEFHQNLTKAASFRKKYGLEGKFIFLFAGIIGPAQGLDFLINVAKEISNQDIVFLLVGDGMERKKIQEMIDDYSLKNVIIKPFVSKEDYPYLLKEINVGIVCLNNKNKTPFLPGKFLGYLAAERPVVAFLNKESDGFSFVRETKCGYAVTSDNLDDAVEIVRKIYNEKEKLKQFGQNGFRYASDNLTVDTCIEKLEKLFR